MYKIGEFSRLCRVSVKTLRYYDSLGILRPDMIDSSSGYRYYSPSKLLEFSRIAALKDIGFSLEEIRDDLRNIEGGQAAAILEKKHKELENTIDDLQSRLRKVETLKKLTGREGMTMFNVAVRESDSVKVAAERKIFFNREEALQKTAEIRSSLKRSGISAGDYNIIVNYEIEHIVEDLDMEACVPISGKLPALSPYQEKTITFSESIACLTCKKDEIEQAYSALQLYIGENRLQITGAFCEIFHDDGTLEIKVPVHRLLNQRLKEPIRDDINVPFTNDDDVVGRWEVIDCLPSREQFNPLKPKFTGEKWINELYFLPGGESYWCFGWTKGQLIYTTGDGTAALCRYSIDDDYMFIDFKFSEYSFYGGVAEVYVLKRADRKRYAKDEIGLRDKTDDPFLNDPEMPGRWEACDYVEEPERFDPDNLKFPKSGLFFKEAEFLEDGKCSLTYDGRPAYSSPAVTWTKGILLHHGLKKAEHYQIRRIKGCDYLFIEWKSGDYVFGKREPFYYVFRRA